MPDAKVEVAVPVATRAPTESGLNESARLIDPVPPRAVEPDPTVLDPFPKVMEELAKLALVITPAGRDTLDVAVNAPVTREPMVEDEIYSCTP